MQGPTLLSLSRLLDSSVSEVSRGIIGAALGSMCGAFLCNYLYVFLDISVQSVEFPKFPDPWLANKCVRQKDAIAVVMTCLLGLPFVLIATIPNIYCFYAFLVIFGFGSTSISIAVNSDCLEIWRGHRGGGPAMYAMNFGFAFGTFIGPLLAAGALQAKNGAECLQFLGFDLNLFTYALQVLSCFT